MHTADRLVPPHRQTKLAAAIPGSRTISLVVDHLGVAREPGAYIPALLAARRQVLARRMAWSPQTRSATA